MASNTLNTRDVELFRKAIEMSALAAFRIVNAFPAKDKLDDAKEKALYVRATRILHTACEAIDGNSYRDIEEARDKGGENGLYKRIRKQNAQSKVTAPKAPVTPSSTSNTTNEN